MAENLTLKKQQRNAIRLNCNKELNKSVTLMESISPDDVPKIKSSLVKLNDYRARLNDLNDQILGGLSDENAIVVEIQKSSDVDEEILDSVANITTKLENMGRDRVGDSGSVHHSESRQTLSDHKLPSVRLPKLEIAKFSGDMLKWQEFWDSFETTVHDNDDLSAVDKFKYLRSFLAGDALRLIEGYRLTSANYDAVVAVLSERYGHKQTAINAHLEAILSLPMSSYETHKLQKTYDECEKHIRSLMALGLEEATFGKVFVPIIMSKLPPQVKTELHRKNGTEEWTLSSLRSCLKDEIRARELSQRPFAGGQSSDRDRPDSRPAGHSRFGAAGGFQRKPESRGASSTLLANSTGHLVRCSFCSGSHYSDQCTKFPDLKSRKIQIRGRCYICLSSGHQASKCSNPRPCAYCQSTQHNRSLCEQSVKTKPPRKEKTDVSLNVSESAASGGPPQINSTLLSHGETVVLQTALADVQGNTRARASARLLFDTGCSRSFISKNVAERIRARPMGTEVLAMAGFSDTRRKSQTYRLVEFEVCLLDGTKQTLTANVIDNISCPIQKFPLDVSKYPCLRQMSLADPPLSDRPELVELDILIGTDYYYDFVHEEQIKCQDGLIFLSSSLGFIATGRISAIKGDNSVSTLVCSMGPLLDTNFCVEKFWTLEDIGVRPPDSTTADEQALDHFNRTINFKDGRYHVSFPFKDDAIELPTNKRLALRRLESTLKKIAPNKQLFDQYQRIINDQEQQHIIEKVVDDIPVEKVHYIPHHVVVTPHKSTTKLRIVYDASAKASKMSPSLNECLHRGPVMLDDLCGLLLRFRLYPVAIVSDIEKAFLQVGLNESSRDFTRFFWIRDPTLPPTGDNLIVYRFARVPFGFAPSPFLLAAAINYHVKQSESPAAKQIGGNLYVDNVITGLMSVDEAKQFYSDAKGFFREASMNLREWFSNNKEVMETIPAEDRGASTVTKVLGMAWNTVEDVLSCGGFDGSAESVKTKRQMLKSLAKVFDPCGLFSAVTVKGKLLIQRLWKEKFEWDDNVPKPLADEWEICALDLGSISSHSIRRCVNPAAMSDNVIRELHTFCDASAKAYAAVVYVKVRSDKDTSVDLIFGKSRIGPIKELSIPRMELMAALVGSRIMDFVAKEMKIDVAAKYLWSDSQCVLHWITGKPVSTTFVKNRVNEIKSYEGVTFRYVPTAENPADLSSRGCSYNDLSTNILWWHGPHWLCRHSTDWPSTNIATTVTENESAVLLAADDASTDVNETAFEETRLDAGRFSSLKRLLRVSAWVRRFVNNCRKLVVRSGELTARELTEAELTWVKHVQRKQFPACLKQSDTKERRQLSKSLDLFIDNNGVLRCGGRLQSAAELSNDAKCPTLLPKNEHFTDLVIADRHSSLCHAGVAHTLSQVRYKYWIIHGRGQVKRVIRRCRLCNLLQGGSFRLPNHPQLPDFRVSRQTPFSCVGVDYLGPLHIKGDQQSGKKKVWICLFTCAAVRAVHLEVVENLTTDQFLMCLRRFASLHRNPRIVVSDNAKHFHTANKFMNQHWRSVQTNPSVQSFCADSGIRWKFITELAPWMGGFYERLIGVVKRALKRSLDRRCVTLVELQTVVSEICATINSRPLVYPEAGVSDPPLTPEHFLRGPSGAFDEVIDSDDDYRPKAMAADNLVKTWRRIKSILDTFWKMWQAQYLLSLRASVRWGNPQRNVSELEPAVGTTVLIKDNMPRNLWKLGVIIKLKRSEDGDVRTVTLRLPNRKQITRPIRLLCPLEASACGGDSFVGEGEPVRGVGANPIRIVRPRRKAAHADQIANNMIDDDDVIDDNDMDN